MSYQDDLSRFLDEIDHLAAERTATNEAAVRKVVDQAIGNMTSAKALSKGMGFETEKELREWMITILKEKGKIPDDYQEESD